MTFENLNKLTLETLSEFEKEKLVNLENIVIDSKLSSTKRMLKYLEDVKNPYCFKYKGTVVRICFANTDKTLDSRLVNFFKSLKNY